MKHSEIKELLDMAHSPLSNYVIPGLTSMLLGPEGGDTKAGRVRLFVNSRTQFHHITPHSHRFDFKAMVLRGTVTNITFDKDENGEEFLASKLLFEGAPGKYQLETGESARWRFSVHPYKAGEWYGMEAHEIHTIHFSPDAVVLFIEGQENRRTTRILEPIVDGRALATFKVEPWMFRGPIV